jgi:hypothetical protein
MVTMLKRWTMSIAAVLAWLLVVALAFLIVMVGFNLFQMLIVVTLRTNHYAIQVLEQTYYVIMGLLWLGLFILMEHVLIDKAAHQGMLLQQTLFVIGIEILIVGLLQFSLAFYTPAVLTQVLLTGTELVLGAGLVYFFRRKKIKKNLENL